MNRLSLHASLTIVSALLAACGAQSASVQPVQPAVVPTSISGTLSSWTGGAGSIEMLNDPESNRSASNPALTTGTLNADGSFDLTLPAVATLLPYLIPAAEVISTSNTTGCTGSFTSSAASARAFVSYRLDVRQNGAYVTTATPTSVTDRSDASTIRLNMQDRLWVYADQDTTLSGTQTCTDTQSGITVTAKATMNAALRSGWNLMQQNAVLNATKGSGQATVTAQLTTAASADGPWITESLLKQALDGPAALMTTFRPR